MKHMGSLIVLLSGLAVTLAAWLLLGALTEEASESRFVQECSLLNNRMQTQLDQQTLMLRGLETALASYVDIVRDVFEITASVPGNSQPGIKSIGYASFVLQKELTSYVDYVRRSAYPGFYVHPKGLRESYLPIEYEVLRNESGSLLGLDLLTILPIEKAMDTTQTIHVVDLAVDSAENASPHNTMLSLSVRSQPAPIGSRGTCFVILDPRALLASALMYSYDSSRIAFAVTNSGTDHRVMFSPASMSESTMVHYDSLSIGDAVWQVEYRARSSVFQSENQDLPSFLLIVGIIFTTIIFILIRIVEKRFFSRSK
ncbi:MAG: CHASE domain-containing protein [Bacteroidota bacterium]